MDFKLWAYRWHWNKFDCKYALIDCKGWLKLTSRISVFEKSLNNISRILNMICLVSRTFSGFTYSCISIYFGPCGFVLRLNEKILLLTMTDLLLLTWCTSSEERWSSSFPMSLGLSWFKTIYFAWSSSSISRCCATRHPRSLDRNASPSWVAISPILVKELFPIIYPSWFVMRAPPMLWTAPFSRFIPISWLACVPCVFPRFRVPEGIPSRIFILLLWKISLSLISELFCVDWC